MVYGDCEVYGRRVDLKLFKSFLTIKRGFIPLNMGYGLCKDLSKRGMTL